MPFAGKLKLSIDCITLIFKFYIKISRLADANLHKIFYFVVSYSIIIGLNVKLPYASVKTYGEVGSRGCNFFNTFNRQ